MLTSQYGWDIPTTILKQIKKLFSPGISEDAQRIFHTSKISISFVKETPGRYYIISGIVKDLRFYESKLIFKKSGNKKILSSNCDCHSWTASNHCPHIVCLFVNYHINKTQRIRRTTANRPQVIGQSIKLGVSTSEYGSIIPGAHHLKGAPGNCSYSSLMYLLRNRKIVNFPIPQDFKGKLIFNIKSSISQCSFFFKYQDISGKEFKEISLLENIYLFNWRTGRAYHLPSELKQFIQKMRIQRESLDINDLLQISTQENIIKFCETRIGKTPLEKIKQINPEVSLIFSQKKKNNKMLSAELIFHDSKKRTLSPPPFIKHFTFKGGMLSSFRKKTDGYNFIDNFVESLEGKEESYKKNLLASTHKNRWNELIANLMKSENTLFYDPAMKVLCLYDNNFLRLLLKSFCKNFGNLFFRYAEYLELKRTCHYQISLITLFQGLSEFHHTMSMHGLSIFYNKREISKWTSKVRFESRPRTSRWFSLELSLSDSDLEIIESTDVENSLANTSKGLTLLTKDQKELIKFMKKYIKHESKEKWEHKDKNNEENINTFLLPFNRIRIFELFELKKLGVKGTLSKEEEELCERLSTLEKMPEYPLPPSIDKYARPYQKTGYNWLRFLYENRLGACLADDMGLGKTLQTIGLIESIYSKIKKILVICPVSLLINWKNEIEKFSDMQAIIYHGGGRTLPSDVKIFLTSYGVMKKEADSIFAHSFFDLLILDEVQHLKN
ncbi:MAG: DEAD/DEAH box helicase, partial [Halobacteriovoraceae bacterium]|nr:DEAD/DEAH box helicase [Halobacteriovoraceae bacterium]